MNEVTLSFEVDHCESTYKQQYEAEMRKMLVRPLHDPVFLGPIALS